MLRDFEPTCTENTFLDSKGLHLKVEGEEGERAADGVVLLLVTHVGAADRRLPQGQVGVPPNKHALKETHTYEEELDICLLLSAVSIRYESCIYQSLSFR